MSRIATAVVVGLNVFGIVPHLLGSDSAKKPVESVHTEKVAFAPGGVIRVANSLGNLTIEGWDRPEVEVRVHKAQSHDYPAAQREQALLALERVRVTTEKKSDEELEISTELPRKRFWHLWGRKGGVTVCYQLHVPQRSRLVVHHGPGTVLIGDVSGDLEVTSSSGDIMLMLDESKTYSVDARSKLGTVESDLDGAAHRRHISGSAFVSSAPSAAPSPANRLYLRTGMGGITIKLVPAMQPTAAQLP